MALGVYLIVALFVEMEQGINRQLVRLPLVLLRTRSSQNSLTRGVAASSSQNSLKGSALLVLLRTQRPAVVDARSR